MNSMEHQSKSVHNQLTNSGTGNVTIESCYSNGRAGNNIVPKQQHQSLILQQQQQRASTSLDHSNTKNMSILAGGAQGSTNGLLSAANGAGGVSNSIQIDVNAINLNASGNMMVKSKGR